MANTKSAQKRIRQTKTRTERNKAAKSRLRTLRKKVVASVEEGQEAVIKSALSEFTSAADKAAKSGLIHRKTADRLKSRAAIRVGKAAKAS